MDPLRKIKPQNNLPGSTWAGIFFAFVEGKRARFGCTGSHGKIPEFLPSVYTVSTMRMTLTVNPA